MRTVNIAELKNKLSTYITYAKSGEEVLIRDRSRAVARLVPLAGNDVSEEEAALVANGVMQLPREAFDVDAFLALPMALEGEPSPLHSPLTQALLSERNEGR